MMINIILNRGSQLILFVRMVHACLISYIKYPCNEFFRIEAELSPHSSSANAMQQRFQVHQAMEESCMQRWSRARGRKPEHGGRRKSSSSINQPGNTTPLHSPQHLALPCQTASLSRENSLSLPKGNALENPARKQKATRNLLLRTQPLSHSSRVPTRFGSRRLPPRIPGLKLRFLRRPLQP